MFNQIPRVGRNKSHLKRVPVVDAWYNNQDYDWEQCYYSLLGLHIVSLGLLLSFMNIYYFLPLVDPPLLDVMLVVHRPDCVQEWIYLKNLLLGNQLPVFLIWVAVGFLQDGPYRSLPVWLLHFLVKIHGLFVCIGHIGDRVINFLLSVVVLFHHGLIEFSRLWCIGHISVSWLSTSTFNIFPCVG